MCSKQPSKRNESTEDKKKATNFKAWGNNLLVYTDINSVVQTSYFFDRIHEESPAQAFIEPALEAKHGVDTFVTYVSNSVIELSVLSEILEHIFNIADEPNSVTVQAVNVNKLGVFNDIFSNDHVMLQTLEDSLTSMVLSDTQAVKNKILESASLDDFLLLTINFPGGVLANLLQQSYNQSAVTNINTNAPPSTAASIFSVRGFDEFNRTSASNIQSTTSETQADFNASYRLTVSRSRASFMKILFLPSNKHRITKQTIAEITQHLDIGAAETESRSQNNNNNNTSRFTTVNLQGEYNSPQAPITPKTRKFKEAITALFNDTLEKSKLSFIFDYGNSNNSEKQLLLPFYQASSSGGMSESTSSFVIKSLRLASRLRSLVTHPEGYIDHYDEDDYYFSEKSSDMLYTDSDEEEEEVLSKHLTGAPPTPRSQCKEEAEVKFDDNFTVFGETDRNKETPIDTGTTNSDDSWETDEGSDTTESMKASTVKRLSLTLVEEELSEHISKKIARNSETLLSGDCKQSSPDYLGSVVKKLVMDAFIHLRRKRRQLHRRKKKPYVIVVRRPESLAATTSSIRHNRGLHNQYSQRHTSRFDLGTSVGSIISDTEAENRFFRRISDIHKAANLPLKVSRRRLCHFADDTTFDDDISKSGYNRLRVSRSFHSRAPSEDIGSSMFYGDNTYSFPEFDDVRGLISTEMDRLTAERDTLVSMFVDRESEFVETINELRNQLLYERTENIRMTTEILNRIQQLLPNSIDPQTLKPYPDFYHPPQVFVSPPRSPVATIRTVGPPIITSPAFHIPQLQNSPSSSPRGLGSIDNNEIVLPSSRPRVLIQRPPPPPPIAVVSPSPRGKRGKKQQRSPSVSSFTATDPPESSFITPS